MFASSRAFWSVASRPASSPAANRIVTITRQSNVRLASSAASAPATASKEQVDATPPSAQQASPPEPSSTKPAASAKPSYPTSAPSSKPATKTSPKPAAKTIAKPLAKPAPTPPAKSKAPVAAAIKPTTSAIPVTVAEDDLPSNAERLSSMDIDWATSYHGISSRPVTEKQFAVLMAPIDTSDIEVKPDGIIYLPEIKYRRRLNQAFGPMGWGMIPRGEAVVGDNIVTREYALIVGGRFVAQAQGENQYFSPEQLPSSVEGCKSNALMRCCKDLGIASELWDPSFIRKFRKNNMEAHWVEHASTNKKRQMWFRKGCVEVAYPYKLAK